MVDNVTIKVKGIDGTIQSSLATLTNDIEKLRVKFQPMFDVAQKHFSGLSPFDKAAIATSTIPIVGDLAGFAADANMFITDPESRTIMNAGLSAMGLLPFVPSAGVIKDIAAPIFVQGKKTIPVGINPSRSELKEILGNDDTFRIIQDPDSGRDFIWASDDALHNDIGKAFDLDRKRTIEGIIDPSDLGVRVNKQSLTSGFR